MIKTCREATHCGHRERPTERTRARYQYSQEKRGRSDFSTSQHSVSIKNNVKKSGIRTHMDTVVTGEEKGSKSLGRQGRNYENSAHYRSEFIYWYKF